MCGGLSCAVVGFHGNDNKLRYSFKVLVLRTRKPVMSGVVPNSDPCQIITPLVLVCLGLGVEEGLGLRVGLGSVFSDPPSDFFPKKRLATNLATSWTNLSESLWLAGTTARERDIAFTARTHLPLSLLLSLSLLSERQRGAALSVKIDDVASLILHANIAENTAQELSLSLLMLCVFDFIRRL